MSQESEQARQALRQQTADDHDRVEALFRLGEPDIGWPAYLAALEALAAVYTVAAAALDHTDIGDLAPGPRARLNVHLTRLHRDIGHGRRHLGVGAPAGMPRIGAPPTAWRAAHGFGVLYVVEGSTLGGQHIARNVGQRLGLTPAAGMAFFYGDGEQTGALWRVYRADLARHVIGAARVAEAVAGARWTFDSVRRTREALNSP